ncbi:MAG: ABC transporter substrate-binding protein [Nocardiopsaceae bacterium]|nr:ABC transporter substrate-binding protein [Nocardiopsaceae bacterium]
MRIRFFTATAVVAAIAVSGCSSASSGSSPSGANSSASGGAAAASEAFPVTVTAANGKVTLKSEPTRIVSLSPTATEDLYAVGAGSQVAAVDETSNYPAGVPKTSMSGINPNIEAIARYNPGLVIDAGNYNGLVAGLRKLGVPVLIEPTATSIDDAYAQIDQIGRATGHATQAKRVTDRMKHQIAADVAKAGADHKDLSYYWEVSANPYYSATSKTLFGQIAGLFGLKDIADAATGASNGGYPELSEEYIVAAKPRLIFLSDNAPGDGGQTPAVVAKRPGWSAVPAVKDHEVIPLNDDIASRWGPRLPQLVAAIAQAVENAPTSR